MTRIASALLGLWLAFSAIPASAQTSPAGIYREQGVNPNGEPYIGMAAIVPDGGQYRVIWWIAQDVFNGKGAIEGDKLVVHWSEPEPVIYHLRDGLLEGAWAGGAAKDRLELFAPIDSKPAPEPLGYFQGDGVNPNGATYHVTVEITRRGGEYQFFWTAQGQNYSGLGRREGNLMIVDWGSTMPMIFALHPDGTLSGLFDSGRGSETLTPRL